jgi:nicotinate-nucleotide pyrophosphorylase (carboxylating)
MQLNISVFSEFLTRVLHEDVGICGDITTNLLINDEFVVNYQIIAKQNLILSGSDIAQWYLVNFADSKPTINFKDSSFVNSGDIIIEGSAKASKILLVERVILNFMQHMSGIATETRKYVEEVSHTKTKIADTRKTIPGIRSFQKYAVRCGGGYNHRYNLDSCILIKDNHLAISGSIREVLDKAKKLKPHFSKVIIECDSFDQFVEACDNGSDIIMLDNMTPSEIIECIKYNNGRSFLEASGGINITNVKEYANTGIDLISVGALTHSVKSVDISLDLV